MKQEGLEDRLEADLGKLRAGAERGGSVNQLVVAKYVSPGKGEKGREGFAGGGTGRQGHTFGLWNLHCGIPHCIKYCREIQSVLLQNRNYHRHYRRYTVQNVVTNRNYARDDTPRTTTIKYGMVWNHVCLLAPSGLHQPQLEGQCELHGCTCTKLSGASCCQCSASLDWWAASCTAPSLGLSP